LLALFSRNLRETLYYKYVPDINAYIYISSDGSQPDLNSGWQNTASL